MKITIVILAALLSFPAVSAKRAENRITIKEASNGIDLKRKRRMGVGLQAAGSMGLGGILLELNFDPVVGFTVAYGGGEGFQAVGFQGKYVLGGDWLLPYASVGYAHWSSTGKSSKIENTRPNILADRLLTDEEKTNGEYSKHLIYPAFGLQLMQLKGPYAGFSFFVEVVVLFEPRQFLTAPTGSLGTIYYF